jgi:hypothetical protein
VCGRVRVEDCWFFPDREQDDALFYTYCYCPACLENALAELTQMERRPSDRRGTEIMTRS